LATNSELVAPAVGRRAGGAEIPICTALKNIECAQNLQMTMM
jgi:hypothetical protein